MAVLNKEDFLNKIKERLGDDTSDEALSFLEDMTDTVNDLTEKAENNDGEVWKKKCEETEKTWREKYKARFFEGSENNKDDDPQPKDTEKDEETERAESITVDDLFN